MDRSLKYYKVLEKELRKKNGQKEKESFPLLQERAKLMEYAKRRFQYNMYPQGVEALIQASVLGGSEASFLVGTCYGKGIGVEKIWSGPMAITKSPPKTMALAPWRY